VFVLFQQWPKTVWFRIKATHDGLLRLRDNFGGRKPEFSRKDVVKNGVNFEVMMNAGDVLEGWGGR
jgi:alpha-L-fucosidase 2